MHILQQSNCGEKKTILSERLLAIAESLPKNAVVCDVGSDHGILPLYLLKEAGFSEVFVTDLNPLPLERAKKNLEEAGVSSAAHFILTDGIEEVIPFYPDVFVIAGMGGETISGILDRAIQKIPFGTNFVLQPMTRDSILRQYLYQSGFLITNETVVYENKKFFPIIWCTFDGISRPEKCDQCFLGEFLPQKKNEDTRLYFQSLLSRVEKKMIGKRVVCADTKEEEEQSKLLLSLIKEFS